MSEIWRRRYEQDKERRDKMKEAMEEYDQKIYWPARKQLIEDCEQEGHSQGKFHDNGLGWTWWWCGKCGTSWDSKRYNGETE